MRTVPDTGARDQRQRRVGARPPVLEELVRGPVSRLAQPDALVTWRQGMDRFAGGGHEVGVGPKPTEPWLVDGVGQVRMRWDDRMTPREREVDPLEPSVLRAVAAGWTLVPQISHGSCDNALIRTVDGITDVVTIPLLGYSTAVRLDGGPRPGQPRRSGNEEWRRHLPVDDAMAWLLDEPGEYRHPDG